MKVYLLYETDAWISTESKVLMGIYTTDENLLNGVRKIVEDRYQNDVTFVDMDEDEDEREPETLEEMQERIVDEFCDNDLQTVGNYEVQLYATEVELDKTEEIS